MLTDDDHSFDSDGDNMEDFSDGIRESIEVSLKIVGENQLCSLPLYNNGITTNITVTLSGDVVLATNSHWWILTTVRGES